MLCPATAKPFCSLQLFQDRCPVLCDTCVTRSPSVAPSAAPTPTPTVPVTAVTGTTNACGVSAGSCYDSTTHVVSCDVADEDCSGYWYSPGYVSGYSGCCHCQASCGNVTADCADNYYDDP